MLTPKQRRWLPFATAIVLLAAPVQASAAEPAPTTTVAPPAVPEGTLYVAPDGAPGNPGTSPSQPMTVDAAVQAAHTGGTIAFLGGTYRAVSLTVGTRLTLMANPGDRVVLKGSETVAGWVQEGMLWTADAPAAKQPAPSSDLLFLDGKKLDEVADRSEVVSGTFFADHSAHKLVIGDDPTGGTVESVVAENAFRFEGAGRTSTVKGLEFQQYAGAALVGLTKPAPVDPKEPPTTRPPSHHGGSGARPPTRATRPAPAAELATAPIGATLPAAAPAATPAAQTTPKPKADAGPDPAAAGPLDAPAPDGSGTEPVPGGSVTGLVQDRAGGLWDGMLDRVSRSLPALAVLDALALLGLLLLVRARRRRRRRSGPAGPPARSEPLALPAPAKRQASTAAARATRSATVRPTAAAATLRRPVTGKAAARPPAAAPPVRSAGKAAARRPAAAAAAAPAAWKPARTRRAEAPAQEAARPSPAAKEVAARAPSVPVPGERVAAEPSRPAARPTFTVTPVPLEEPAARPAPRPAEPPARRSGGGGARFERVAADAAGGTPDEHAPLPATVAVTDREGSIARLEEWIGSLSEERASPPPPKGLTRLFRGSRPRT